MQCGTIVPHRIKIYLLLESIKRINSLFQYEDLSLLGMLHYNVENIQIVDAFPAEIVNYFK